MNEFYEDGQVHLHQADVLAWALDYKALIDAGEALPFHATVTDPPYGLSEPPPIEKVLTAWLAGDAYEHNKGGFMGKAWDNLPPGPQFWRALLDIHYPGAYLFAFSGTRTADLLGIACRLGGWEPFDRVASFGWVQGQGMVKNTNISKMLDKEAGAERKIVDTRSQSGAKFKLTQELIDNGGFNDPNRTEFDITAPATPLAQTFHGYGNAIAPKHEPILLFRKPREGYTFARCAREFGSGGLDIESTRVKTTDKLKTLVNDTDERDLMGAMKGKDITGRKIEYREPGGGRWPPNTHFSHVQPDAICPTCEGSGFVRSVPLTESFKAWYAKTKDYGGSREEWQRLREPTGTSICSKCHGRGVIGGCRRVGGKRVRGAGGDIAPGSKGTGPRCNQVYGKDANDRGAWTAYKDADGKETVADWVCVEGCAVRALDEMAGERRSAGLVNKTTGSTQGNATWNLGTTSAETGVNAYNDKGSASRFYPNHDWSYEIAERLAGETPFSYNAKASRGERDAGLGELPDTTLPEYDMLNGSTEFRHDSRHPDGGYTVNAKSRKNIGPCVKPLSLTRWLGLLACPPPQFSPRLCVPFAGTGSEVIGAILAGGWAEIHAIEREQEYCETAAARIAWWTKWAALTGKPDPAEIRKLGEAAEAKTAFQGDERQTSMFEMLGSNGRTPGVQGARR